MDRCYNCRWSWQNWCEDNAHDCQACPMYNDEAGFCKCHEMDDAAGLSHLSSPNKCPYYEKYEKEI